MINFLQAGEPHFQEPLMKSFRLGWVVAVLFLCASGVWAEPYLAAWKGVNCNACHVNQTGGWLRNDFGKNYGASLATFDWQGISEAAQKIKRDTPSWIAVGVDIHESYTQTFNSNPNTNQSSFYQSPFSQYIPGREAFSVQAKANEAISGVFTYRLDEQVVKEVYALISGMPEGAYFKLGKFMMPYGLTLADDNSLVREALGSNALSFDNPTNDGVEAGVYPDPFFLNAAVVNGSSLGGSTTVTGYNEKIFSGKGGICFSPFTVGGSVYGENIDLNTRRLRYGSYGWGRVGPVVVLAEYDRGYDGIAALTAPGPVTSQTNYQAYHVSAEVDLGSSVYLRLANEWLNDSMQTDANDGFRDVLTLRFYPVENLKTQIDFIRMDPVIAVNKPNYAVVADAFMFY